MEDKSVKLTSNGLGAQVYLPRELFRHSEADLEPGDEAIPEVLEDGSIALRPIESEDSPVDGNTTGTRREIDLPSTGTRREHDGNTTGDADGGGLQL